MKHGTKPIEHELVNVTDDILRCEKCEFGWRISFALVDGRISFALVDGRISFALVDGIERWWYSYETGKEEVFTNYNLNMQYCEISDDEHRLRTLLK